MTGQRYRGEVLTPGALPSLQLNVDGPISKKTTSTSSCINSQLLSQRPADCEDAMARQFVRFIPHRTPANIFVRAVRRNHLPSVKQATAVGLASSSRKKGVQFLRLRSAILFVPYNIVATVALRPEEATRLIDSIQLVTQHASLKNRHATY